MEKKIYIFRSFEEQEVWHLEEMIKTTFRELFR